MEIKDIPQHVAIIMDGNGRWAKKRLMNRVRGHQKGMEVVREVVRACRESGVKVLTLYAFSTENWHRPKTEVAALMEILKRFLVSERKEMLDNNIRLHAIGEIHRLPEEVRKILAESLSLTGQCSGMVLNLALSYGGRAEIVSMVKAIGKKIATGQLKTDEISETMVNNHLYTESLPDPDIMIRTSGEMRISNFLLWQLAYAELFITETLWPDFGKEELYSIFEEYRNRSRRFGRVAE